MVESSQWFEVSPEADSPNSALRQPVVHESAYKHASGEAIYVDDMAPRQGMLGLDLSVSPCASSLWLSVSLFVSVSLSGCLSLSLSCDCVHSYLKT